jgi:hypothetical protein
MVVEAMKTRIVILALVIFLIFQYFNAPTNNEHNYSNQTKENILGRDIPLSISPNTRSGGVTFTNVTPEVGLEGVRGDSYAWGDYNNDGFLDLLVKDHVNGKSHLFKNNGPPDWDFTDVTDDAGLEGAGYAVWGDYNNDGYLDFFSVGQTNADPDGAWDTLWMNNGPPGYTFTNMTGPAGNLNDGMPGLAAGWADYDRDGFLDIYVVNWRDLDGIEYPDVLWHNNGDGTFSDVTVDAGVWEGDNPYAGMGMNWGDYNNDGWPDIYVSNYLVMPNYLYENNQDGTFTDVAFEKNAAGDAPAEEYYGHTAGSSWCDYDHDGDLDMWVTNLAHTTDPRGFYTDYSQMLRNNGPPDYDFTDVRDETGIAKKPDMSTDELHFGIAWGDYDNDGDYDMFIPQVKNLDYAYSYFFENNGDGTFTNVSDEVGVKVWNTDGGCWADYNNDGYIDLITEGKEPFENGTYHVRLFRNNGESGNNWLEVGIEASQSNFASIGARVSVSYDGVTMMKEVEGGTAGHAYQASMVQHFGFGDYDGTVDVTVWWPSGREITRQNIALNQKITIREFEYDLRVSEISFSKSNPGVGETVIIYATIKNSGNNIVDFAKINFDGVKIDGNGGGPQTIGTQNLNNHLPGEEQKVQIVWDTTDFGGSNSIIVEIDEVSPNEEYTLNNQGSRDITVREPDLAVSQISFSNPQPLEGELVTITAEIANLGEYEAESASVYFYDSNLSSSPLRVMDLSEVPLGAKETVGINWDTEGEEGNHNIIVTIKNIFPGDKSSQNNQGSRSIEVIGEEQDHEPPASQNNPPEIIEFTAEPSKLMVGESCMLTVLAEDADGDALSFSYIALNGFLTGSGNSVTWHAPNYHGIFEISIVVSDGKDEISGTITVEVVANTPPSFERLKLSLSEVYSTGEESVLITAEVFDENGLSDIEEVRVDLFEIGGSSRKSLYDDGTNGDKTSGDGIYSLEVVIPQGLQPGEKTISVTVIDKWDGEFTQEVFLTILETNEEEDESFLSLDYLIYILAIISLCVIIIVLRIILRTKGKGANTRNY